MFSPVGVLAIVFRTGMSTPTVSHGRQAQPETSIVFTIPVELLQLLWLMHLVNWGS